MQIQKPDYHSTQEFINRSRKLSKIRNLGIDPYPAVFKPDVTVEKLLEKYDSQPIGDSECAEKGLSDKIALAGRLVLFRAMGKNIFAQIQDENKRVQIMFNKEHTLVQGFNATEELSTIKFIEKELDLGDFIGIEGNIFRTHKGEITIYVKKVILLCKSLLPLPDKYSGLSDIELRYRKRWLDLINHDDVAATFKIRSKILKFIRDYFDKYEFIEVETPILQNIYGGAEARPFTTHINALDHKQMYLRISLEIALKKLIIGGMRKVFELSKVFRNEGIDKTHNPEFTMVEAYAAYWDYNDMMVFVENLFEEIALTLFGTTDIIHPHPKTGEPITLNLKAPWIRLSMKDAIKTYAGINVSEHTDDELRQRLTQLGTLDPKEIQKAVRGELIALLFEELVETHLVQPHHIIDHPIETTPLCKLHRNQQERSENLVERFESFILTKEICNSYSELNDPELQRQLLENQAHKRENGDEEAHPLDEEFLESICQGMPPTAGIGIGIDRLVMIFTKAISIRDVIYFPIMKLHQEN
jgi:lysyl-tRNA synthetase class 2